MLLRCSAMSARTTTGTFVLPAGDAKRASFTRSASCSGSSFCMPFSRYSTPLLVIAWLYFAFLIVGSLLVLEVPFTRNKYEYNAFFVVIANCAVAVNTITRT